jgi:glutamine cyclotransferase
MWSRKLRFHRLEVLRRLPHPGRGFTQGLVADAGTVWESTGQYGESSLRRYRLGAKQLEACAMLPPELFGEGICRVGDSLWQLVWQDRIALRWDPGTMELLETIPYNREGWGICAAGEHVLTSDGSSELVRRNPSTLEPVAVTLVRCAGQRVTGLNDLAWAGERVWANVIGMPYLTGIDPESGDVTDIVDAHAVRERHWGDPQAVMNGITPLSGPWEFLLTGKSWRRMYHARLRPARPRPHPEHLFNRPVGPPGV